MIYQELSLAPDLTVAENIFLGREPLSFAPLGVVNRREMNGRASIMLKEYGFKLDPRAYVRRLSAADRQLVDLAVRADQVGYRGTDQRRGACEVLTKIEAATCRQGSAWSCNELGIRLAPTGRTVEGFSAPMAFRLRPHRQKPNQSNCELASR